MLQQPPPSLMRQKSMLLLGKLLRTKEPDIEPESDKKKLLTTSDLCSLGVGSCVGTGMYLVSGLVIRNYAGPGAIISFTIAAIASLLSGVCYAEFGVRIPQSTGTAYHYAYASVGEFIAFLIGWTLIAEYMISTAAGASAIAAAIDTLFNGRISGFSNSAMDLVMTRDGSAVKPSTSLERPRNNKFTVLSHQRDFESGQSGLSAFERYSMLFDGSTYRPDFMAAVLCILMTLVLISGVKKSVKFNNYLNLFNAGVFLFIIIAALPLMSLKYWRADFYNSGSYNTTTNNYLNRSRQVGRTADGERGSYRVPYQRGLVSRWEAEGAQFDRHLADKHYLIKRSPVDSVKARSPYRRRKRERNNLRTRFENLFSQRFRRSIENHQDGRRKSEHDANVAGWNDDEEEDEDLSVVTPAPGRLSTTTPVKTTSTTEPSTTTVRFELPTFKTMIRFTTSTTTLEPFTEEFFTEPPVYTLAPQERPTTERSTTTTTTTTTPSTTTTEKLTTTTTEKPSSSTKKALFVNDSDEDEEETTTTEANPESSSTTEGSYEEEPSTKKQEEGSEEEQEEIEGAPGGARIRSTTQSSTVIRSTTKKPRGKSTKAKGKGAKSKPKPTAKAVEKERRMENGFLQFGWNGVLRGSATCFYAFIGFDIISSTGGQTEQPTKSIPIALVGASLITLIIYIVTCLLISLTTPTHLVSSSTALVNIFDFHQLDFIKSIAACGAISSLTVAMFGSMFPLPRVVGAMSQDGLLWRKFAEINYYTGTTVFATLLLGTLTSLIALIFPLQVLVEIMSIGTLLAYTLISACILMLRYQPTKDCTADQTQVANKNSLINCLPEHYRNEMIPEGERYYQQMMVNSGKNYSQIVQTVDPNLDARAKSKLRSKRNLRKFKSFNSSEDSEDYDPGRNGGLMGQHRQASKDDDEEEDDEYLVGDNDNNNNNYNYGSVPYQYGTSGKRTQFAFLEKLMVYLFPYGFRVPGPATEESSFYVMKLLALYFGLVIAIDAILAFGNLTIDRHLLIFILLLLTVSLIFTLFTIGRQPQTKLNLKFKAPGVPYVPALAILINIYLIFRLSYLTLIRFTIWMVIGLLVYFLFSIKNSSLEQLYCNVSGNDAAGSQQQAFYDSTQYYQQPSDHYQTTADQQPDSSNDQSIELKSRQKYIDSSTMSILTTTSNPFLQTDLDTTAQFSKYTANLQDLSSIEEDSITEDAAEQQDEEPEYDVRKNPFLMDY